MKPDWASRVWWGIFACGSAVLIWAVTFTGYDTPAEAPPPAPPARLSWEKDSAWNPDVRLLTDHKTGREYIVVQDSKGIAICPAQP
jgi:ABC-type Fe3+-hydroxamate transport system substrate-binding protein